jgi:hypothetical protein
MRSLIRLSTIIAVTSVIAACSEPGVDRLLTPELSMAAVSSPEQSRGAVIDSDQFPTLFFHFDASRGLLSIHGAGLFGCAGQEVSIADRHIVTTPSAIQQELVAIRDADSWVSVHRAGSLGDAFPDLCGFLAGPTLIAKGFVGHTQTFTNASFAAHWGGTIETPAGGAIHLSEVYQLTADAHDPNNPATWSLNASHILLSLRP